MEELLDEMRVLFDGLQSEVPPIAAENLPDILEEIPSLIGWGKEAATEMPTKPDQPGPFELTREEEILTGSELPTSPRMCTIETALAPTEVPVNTIVIEVVRELEEEQNQAYGVDTTPQPAQIDTVQTGLEEPATERMRELPTPPLGPTPEPISVVTPRPLVPLFPQPAREDNQESLQDSRTDPNPPTSSIITNSCKYRPEYTGRTGSIQEQKISREGSRGDVPRSTGNLVCIKIDPRGLPSPKEALFLSNQGILLKKTSEVAGRARIEIG